MSLAIRSFEEAFKGKSKYLTKMLEVSGELLNGLRDQEILTQEQFEEIRQLDSRRRQVETLIRMLQQRPDKEMLEFCSLLVDNNQKHVVDEIWPKRDEFLAQPNNVAPSNGVTTDLDLNSELKEIYRNIQADVVNSINADSIIDYLFAAQVLSEADTLQLLNYSDRIRKTRELLLLLHASEHKQEFVELHEAIKKEAAYDFLVKKVDDLLSSKGAMDHASKHEKMANPAAGSG